MSKYLLQPDYKHAYMGGGGEESYLNSKELASEKVYTELHFVAEQFSY